MNRGVIRGSCASTEAGNRRMRLDLRGTGINICILFVWLLFCAGLGEEWIQNHPEAREQRRMCLHSLDYVGGGCNGRRNSNIHESNSGHLGVVPRTKVRRPQQAISKHPRKISRTPKALSTMKADTNKTPSSLHRH